MAVSALTALVTTGTQWAVTTAFTMAMAVKTFAISFALSAVSRALMPKPDLSTNTGLSTTVKSPTQPRPVIYGRTKTAGTLVYIQTTDTDGKYLHMVQAMAGHEIDAYEKIYIDDNLAWENGTTVAKYADNVRFKVYKGDQTTADTDLVAESSEWNSNCVLNDTAYIYARLEYDAEVFPNGIPTISAVMRGKKVYNPIDDVTEWSQNPALCIADYINDTKYGLSNIDIDQTALIASAGVCDQQVDYQETGQPAGTHDRYQLNGYIDTSTKVSSNIENMLSAMFGEVVYSQGKLSINAGYYTNPVLDIDESMMVGDITLQTKQSRRSQYNAVKGVFLSSENDYVLADYPSQVSSSYALEDGEPIYLDMTLPFTTDNYRAQRLAKLALGKSRQQRVITVPVNLVGLKLKAGDNIRITSEKLGLSNAVYQVLDYELDYSDGLKVNLVCAETGASLYDWTLADQQDFSIASDVELYDGSALPPTNLNLTAGTTIKSDGTTATYIDASWTAPADVYFDYYEVTITPSGGSATSFTTKEPTHTFVNTEDNLIHAVSVRAYNSYGRASSSLTASVTTQIDTTAPSDITGVTVAGGLQSITLDWTNPSEDDFDLVRIKHNTTNTEPASHSFEVRSDSFVHDIGAYSTTKYYWLAPVDRTGNVGNYVSGGSATTGSIDTGDVTDFPTDLVFQSEITDFITGGQVNANVTDISGGVIQAGTAITVGTGDNVAVLSGLDTTYRFWAGDATPADANFSVTKEGVVNATGAVIGGNITAESLNVEDAEISGTFIAPIGWSDTTYDHVINRGNLGESVTNLIDERIAEYGLSSAGDFGEDDGSFYYNEATQTNSLDYPFLQNFTHSAPKAVDITITGSKTWSKSISPAPANADADNDITITLQTRLSTETEWTDLQTWTRDDDTEIAGGDYALSYGTIYYNGIFISIEYTHTGHPSGDYDYRVLIGDDLGTNYTSEIPLNLQVNEAGSATGGGLDNYADSFTVNNTTGVLTIGRTNSLTDLTADISTYVSNQVSALVDSAPDALNTLDELASALGDDENFSTTVTNSLATKITQADGDARYALHSSVVKTVYQKEMSGSAAGYVSFEFTGYVNTIGRDFYIFDVIGYKDFTDAKSFVHYTVYLNCKGAFGGTLADNTITADVIAHNQSDDANLTFKLERNLTPDNKHKLWIGIDEGYSGIQILHYPTYIGDLTRVSSSDFDFTSTEPTTTTVFEPSIPVLSTGATFTGDVEIVGNGDTFTLRNLDSNATVGIQFTSQGASATQFGHIRYSHLNGSSYGNQESFTIGGTESTTAILADGNFLYRDGIYKKPATGTGAGTRKDTNWDTAYGWGDHSSAGYSTTDTTYTAGSGLILTGTEFKIRWNATDTFTGTYPLVWKASDIPYTSTWLNVNGATDTLHSVNFEASGTVTATGGNSTNWNTAYTYSQVGHLPLGGGTMDGNILMNSYDIKDVNEIRVDDAYKVGSTTVIDSARNATFAGGTFTGDLTISSTSPEIKLVDTNGFTDSNDRIIFRASADNALWQWYDNSEATTTTLMTLDSGGDLAVSGALTVPNLTIGSGSKIKFANNDYIRYDDGTNRFHFDVDGGTSNASVQASTFVGSLSGNASTASKWASARTLSLTGDVTGSVSWDGSANASITATVVNDSHTHDGRYVNVTGDTMSGNLTIQNNTPSLILIDTESSNPTNQSIRIQHDAIDVNLPAGEGLGLRIDSTDTSGTNLNPAIITSGNIYANNTSKVFHDAYHPNADKWTTARTITLSGDLTGSVSIDGSANVTLSGQVVNDSHTHDGRYYTETESDSRFVNVTGDTMTGNLHVRTGGSSGNFSVGRSDAQELSLYVDDRTALIQHQQDESTGEHILQFDISSPTSLANKKFNFTNGNIQVGGTTIIDSNRSISATGLTLDNGESTSLIVKCDDAGVATLELRGDSQGTGRLYVGQSTTHGGGIEYNGDNTPVSTGAGADYVTLWRRSSGVDYWTAKNFHSDNNWYFRGNLYASETHRVFADNYHPNADKWTTARSHTVTLTGDVTGSATQSVDGTGNKTWSITTAVANDSHNHNHSDGDFTVNGSLIVPSNIVKFANLNDSITFEDTGNVYSFNTDGGAGNAPVRAGSYQVGTTTVIDSSRNLTNISDAYLASGKLQARYYASGAGISSAQLEFITDGKTGWGAGDEFGRIRFYCQDGSGIGARDAAEIRAVNNAGNGSNTTTFEGELEFYTSPYNAQKSLAMRLGGGKEVELFNNIYMNGTTVIDSSRNTAFDVCNANAFAGEAGKIVYPQGAHYQTTTSTVSGAIKVILPQSWTSTMMRMTIKVYEYTMNESFEVECGGYNYGSGYWVNTFAHIKGDPSNGRNFNIRFGHDGTKCCILIGEENNTWTYPQVYVTDFQAGFQNYQSSKWDNGWDITFVTTLPSNIDKVHSNSEIGIDGYEKRIGGTVVIDSSRNATFSTLTVTDDVKATASNLRFWAGGNHILNLDLNGKIYPNTDNAYDLGFSTSVARFRNGYFTGTLYSAQLSLTGKATIWTNDDAPLVLRQGQSGHPWNYIEFRDSGNNRNWYVGTSTSGNMEIQGETGATGGVNTNKYFKSIQGFKVGSTTVIDSSRNITGANITASGRINPNNPNNYWNTAVTGLTNAPINFPESNVGANTYYLPWMHSRTLQDGGYRTHVNIGVYKNSGNWNGNGFYVAMGGNDSYPTENFLFSYGGVLSHSQGHVVTPQLRIGDGNDGYFYSDTNGRTAFRSGDFYIQTSVNNYYNYATNQYHGNTSGDNHYFRSNYLGGTNWSINTSGALTANGVTSTGSITASGNITAYSDITLKDNITNIDNALEKVNSIRGVTYDRIDQDSVRHAGVIAQEVEEVLPEVVHTDDDGIKSVAYGNMVGLLIEAIKELKSEIEELKNGNNTN